MDVLVEMTEDTVAGSSDSAMKDDESDPDEDAPPMPLLSYSRLFGSLRRGPEATDATTSGGRAFSVPSTCAVMGQVSLSQQDPISTAAATATPGATTDTRTSDTFRQQPLLSQSNVDPLLLQQTHLLLAVGYADGSIEFVDARTGVSVLPQQPLRLRESGFHQEEAVVAMSMDSTGTFLAAVDSGRMVGVWEFRYTIAMQSSSTNNTASALRPQAPIAQQQQQQAQSTADSGVFSNFMSALKLGGATTTAPASPSRPATTTEAATIGAMVPRLVTSSMQLSRITYPKSFGTPTSIAIDPAYNRKRDKAVLVGFLDGRLVLTKRGLIFQRRTDAIIYQGTYNESNNPGGIEAIEWRGSLAAWADFSGIRLFDTETMARIAHIDRPMGARPSLYPTLSSLRPTLRFETSNYLLVAWGDCLMGLSITDHGRPHVTEESTSPQQAPVFLHRTVECAMAWELDCIASGVVPLDKDHVIVLGLVPDDDDQGDLDTAGGNDLEVQIIAKEDGSIFFANVLPLLRGNRINEAATLNDAEAGLTESAAEYTLLSSFALPRMDDSLEASLMEEEPDIDPDAFDLQVSLFSTTSQATRRFVDPHLKWSLSTTTMYDDSALSYKGNNHNSGEDESIDSDDYDFIFRPLSTTNEDDPSSLKPPAAPPVMIIASSSDIVLARIRDIDDAVEYALGAGRSALALQRGLRQVRHLRKYDKNDLVNEYFLSLLRFSRQELDNDEGQTRPLSLRRLNLAVKAMPVLFGGEILLWERWTAVMGKIPGALFVLSDYLPVRDPVLPSGVYGLALESMLKEIFQMKEGQDNNNAKAQYLIAKAEQRFLNVLTGWGPTNFLKEHIRHCKFGGHSKESDIAIKDAETRFARRFTQSAAGYLCFPVPREENEATADTAPQIRSEGYFEYRQSLFEIDDLIRVVIPHAPIVSGINSTPADASLGGSNSNTQVALDAMARLYMMKDDYEAALKCYISIGALPGGRPLSDFQAAAVDFSEAAGGRLLDKPSLSESGVPYTFLLDIIDSHHLQQCLLDDDFLSGPESKTVVPIFSLLQLVGFNAMGDFLTEHCVPPQERYASPSHQVAGSEEERMGTLPLDLVAAQLESSPRILHWYLRLVFTRKPEAYVRFPNTAYPPRAVIELHRHHFDLYLEFAGKERDSAGVLAGIEPYKVSSVETGLLQFLKTTLPLGGMRIEDAKRALESERAKDDDEFSTSFALELAFIIEQYGDNTESEALEVLDLYMKGAKSLVLAAAYSQRSRDFSTRLWKLLIDHCLEQERERQPEGEHLDGSLFGALLEAAALSGADLAQLVSQIPPGMAIEDLRPRLVAAVADYRLQLKMHEAASEVASQELISLLREVNHRSRRGVKYQLSSAPDKKESESTEVENAEQGPYEENATSQRKVTTASLRRTIKRPDRYRLSITLPIR